MTAVSYNVELDRSQIAEAISLFEFVGGNSDDALRVAINKAGPKVRTIASRACAPSRVCGHTFSLRPPYREIILIAYQFSARPSMTSPGQKEAAPAGAALCL